MTGGWQRGMSWTGIAARHLNDSPGRIHTALIDPAAFASWLLPEGMHRRFERFEPSDDSGCRMVPTYEEPDTAAAKTAADSDAGEARFIELLPRREGGAGHRSILGGSRISPGPGE